MKTMFFTSLSTHRLGFALALADLKVTMVSHVIDGFKFQQAIHEKEEFVPL